MGKRYKGLFIAPNMCDGIYDTWNDPDYNHPLKMEKVIEIMNDSNNQINVWKKKYDQMKDRYIELEKKSSLNNEE